MRRVVIGIKSNGEPYVISCPTKVEVVFKKDKRKPVRKLLRTLLYQIKYALNLL